MEKFKLKAQYYRGVYTKWKSKVALNIVSIIAGSRLHKCLEFAGYGEITFEPEDEKTRWNPIVEMLPEFNRNRCNAIVYNINHVDSAQWSIYDKIIIYNDQYVSSPMYGIFFYNTKTGQCSQQPNMECIPESLFRHINYMFSYDRRFRRSA